MELGRTLFEHPDFIVMDKPAGISVHKDADDLGYVMALSRQRGESLWLVHRLDKMTSGLLVLARNETAAAYVSGLFAKREVDKLYLAISTHKPKRKQGMISGDMQSARRGSWKLLRSNKNPAKTEFTSMGLDEGYRLILCHPLSGKTHQIRVALKSEGAPICGDTRYGGASSDRGYLHAWQLGFIYMGEAFNFRADPLEGQLFKIASDKDLFTRLMTVSIPQHWSLPHLSELADGASSSNGREDLINER